MRKPFAAAGLSLLAATAPLAAQATASDFTWSKRMASGAMLSIRSPNGPIDVRESTSDRVEVRAVKRAQRGGDVRDVTFDVRESADNVEICVVYAGRNMCDRNRGSVNVRVSSAFTVFIPRSLRLGLNTGNGDISIDKAGAQVTVNTGNGRINIGETTGSVDANTGNGDVTVESARGPVHVNTGNGRVIVATASGPVDANTGNGDLDIRIKSTTLDSGMSFNTGAGTIRITLPADFNGDIDMGTGAGTLRTDFDIQVVGRLDPQHVRGRIGKGGATLHLSTGAGNVQIRKG